MPVLLPVLLLSKLSVVNPRKPCPSSDGSVPLFAGTCVLQVTSNISVKSCKLTRVSSYLPAEQEWMKHLSLGSGAHHLTQPSGHHHSARSWKSLSWQMAIWWLSISTLGMNRLRALKKKQSSMVSTAPVFPQIWRIPSSKPRRISILHWTIWKQMKTLGDSAPLFCKPDFGKANFRTKESFPLTGWYQPHRWKRLFTSQHFPV